jgi:hypothetical protein
MCLVRGAWVVGLVLAPVLVSACELTPVPIAGEVARIGDIRLDFGEPDDARHPSAWQGPLRISTGAAPACTASDEVSIIVNPVVFAQGVLYVPTYSGSSDMVYAVDVKTCKVIWRSDDFAGKTRFEKGRLIMGTRPLRVDGHCRPVS